MQEQQGRILDHIDSLSVSTQAALASLGARLLAVESRLASGTSGLHSCRSFASPLKTCIALAWADVADTPLPKYSTPLNKTRTDFSIGRFVLAAAQYCMLHTNAKLTWPQLPDQHSVAMPASMDVFLL